MPSKTKTYATMINGKLELAPKGLTQAMQKGYAAMDKRQCESFTVVISVEKTVVDKQ